MAKLLPKLRKRIKKLFLDKHDKVEIYEIVLEDALKEVNFQDEAWRCINQTITSVVDKRFPPIEFDGSEYRGMIDDLIKKKQNKEFEKKTMFIAKKLLKENGFKQIEDANGNKDMGFNNPPFDLFAFKNNFPYIIEYKGNKNKLNKIGPDQRSRQLRIIDKIEVLNSALIQINYKSDKYRILYNEEIDILYPAFQIPMDSIISWIKKKI
jgi:hypothetical protein